MWRRWLMVIGLAAFFAAITANYAVDAQPRRARGAKPAKDAKREADDAKAEDKDAKDPKKKGDTKAGAGAESEAEGRVVGAETTKKSTGGPSVVEEKQAGDGGVKTYKFGPVDVEGRLKSPQIVYFLRRVRAEFAAGQLGHRSFMRELSDTRRNPALK
jgi:hypothetical protein